MLLACVVLTIMGVSLGGLLGMAAKYLSNQEEQNPLIKEIEQLLPGSQCGQCGFPGCSPAAEAIAEGKAQVTCCPPGGSALVETLAKLLGIDMASLDACPEPMLAAINEALCTGCTRCYKACPTDAIVGASKQLHVVMEKACTGCSKCLDSCPEDCITLATAPVTLNTWRWIKPEAA